MMTGFAPCGLCLASQPLLAACIREERRPRLGRLNAGGSRASVAGPFLRPGLACRPPRTVMEVAAMTAAHLPRGGQAAIVSRRVLCSLRHAAGELARASDAIIRSSAAPRSRQRIRATAARDAHPDTGTGRADRAA
jgi:hypothetical protein